MMGYTTTPMCKWFKIGNHIYIDIYQYSFFEIKLPIGNLNYYSIDAHLKNGKIHNFGNYNNHDEAEDLLDRILEFKEGEQ